ncbi:MAG TPA: hypothetical protein VF909_18580 [Roseiflexaceae bacterium]
MVCTTEAATLAALAALLRDGLAEAVPALASSPRANPLDQELSELEQTVAEAQKGRPLPPRQPSRLIHRRRLAH